MAMKSVAGTVGFLRVHKVGTGYGPPQDYLDAEVIVKLKNVPGAYGFQLRPDNNVSVGEAMVALLSDAFNAGTPVTLEYDEQPGKSNWWLIRVIRQA